MISKEMFVKTMKALERYDKECEEFTDAMLKFTEGFDNNLFMNLTLVTAMQDLLAEIFNDKSDWIGYFMYDCDWLKDDKRNSITLDGAGFKIDSWEDVYEFLTIEDK